MDYTVIPNSIKNTLEKAGCPLTDDQFMLIAGNLAATQQMIESIGLKSTIEVLEPLA
jgi:hypothetical protein